MSSEVGIQELLVGEEDNGKKNDRRVISSADRLLMDDLKLAPDQLESSIFTGAEEQFAFQRAVSRLVEMQSDAWIQRIFS